MVIDEHNYELADAATRDILFLFRDLVISYGGFGHGVNCGQFDPFLFSNVIVRESEGVSLGIDVRLLMSGSAIAIMCAISDAWDETDPRYTLSSPYFKRVKGLLRNDGFPDFPDLRKTLEIGLSDEDRFRARLPVIYEEYVFGYFLKLIGKA